MTVDRIASNENLNSMIRIIGFRNADDFRTYMQSHAKPGEYGGKNYTETRRGWELNYSDNCRHPYGISGNVKGTFRELRFN